MKSPAFQLYADDLIAGTIKFTDAELGLYMRLLCAQWSDGSLPDDDGELSSYGKGKTPLTRVKSKFKKCDDGRLRNERLENVRKEQQTWRDSLSDRGKKGASKRWPNRSRTVAEPSLEDGRANAQALAGGIANGMLADASPVSSLQSPVKEERERALPPETPPMSRKDFDTLSEIRGVPKDCAEHFWNTQDARNWVDARGQAIRKVEPLLMNHLKSWRQADHTRKAGQSAPSGLSSADRVQCNQEYTRILERIRQISSGAASDAMGNKFYTPTEKSDLKLLRNRRDELMKMLGLVA